MKSTYLGVFLLLFVFACASNPEETSENETDTPTTETSSEETASTETESSTAPDPEVDPCDLINLEELAAILDLDAASIELEKDRRGKYCTGKTTELEGEVKSVQFLFFDKFISKDGRPNFEKMMGTMIEKNQFRIPAGPDKGKDVPTRQVEGIGDLAFVCSAANFSTLIYHFDNEIRFTLSLYRKVPGVKFADGFDAPSEELEEKLIAIAKAMHK